jgi:hypothetical protein
MILYYIYFCCSLMNHIQDKERYSYELETNQESGLIRSHEISDNKSFMNY